MSKLINPKMVKNKLDLLTIDEFKIKYPKAAKRIRWKVYEKGRECPTCGVVGTHALVWFSHGDVNLYYNEIHYDMIAYRPDGKMVLMTMDHIIPKSKGGSSKLSNLRTQCSPCNNRKGSRMDSKMEDTFQVVKIIARTLMLFTYGCERKDNG